MEATGIGAVAGPLTPAPGRLLQPAWDSLPLCLHCATTTRRAPSASSSWGRHAKVPGRGARPSDTHGLRSQSQDVQRPGVSRLGVPRPLLDVWTAPSGWDLSRHCLRAHVSLTALPLLTRLPLHPRLTPIPSLTPHPQTQSHCKMLVAGTSASGGTVNNTVPTSPKGTVPRYKVHTHCCEVVSTIHLRDFSTCQTEILCDSPCSPTLRPWQPPFLCLHESDHSR